MYTTKWHIQLYRALIGIRTASTSESHQFTPAMPKSNNASDCTKLELGATAENLSATSWRGLLMVSMLVWTQDIAVTPVKTIGFDYFHDV